MADLNINDLLGKVLENPDAIGRVISLMNSPEGSAIGNMLGSVLNSSDGSAIGNMLGSVLNSSDGTAIGNMLGSAPGGDTANKGESVHEAPSGDEGEKLPVKADPSPQKRDEAACRIALLRALMPYMNENRRGKVEYIMKLMQVMQMVSQTGLLKGGLLK